MAGMGDTIGEGLGGGDRRDEFTSTGYGTDGVGNVETGVRDQEGTGYDEHGQVKTSFGKWTVGYDPVTGAATAHTTTGYNFPASGGPVEGVAPAGPNVGGLGDVSLAAPGHATVGDRSPELREQLESFFQGQPSHAGRAAAETRPPVEPSGDPASGGASERLDAGDYLPDRPELTAQQAEGWRDRRQHDPATEGLDRPPAHPRTGAARPDPSSGAERGAT